MRLWRRGFRTKTAAFSIFSRSRSRYSRAKKVCLASSQPCSSSQYSYQTYARVSMRNKPSWTRRDRKLKWCPSSLTRIQMHKTCKASSIARLCRQNQAQISSTWRLESQWFLKNSWERIVHHHHHLVGSSPGTSRRRAKYQALLGGEQDSAKNSIHRWKTSVKWLLAPTFLHLT